MTRATPLRWLPDPSVTCWRGSHATLSDALGLPGVALLAAALPLVHCALLLCRRPGRIRRPAFLARYGPAYCEYREGAACWEAAVMIRKALLAALLTAAAPDVVLPFGGGGSGGGGGGAMGAAAVQLLSCVLVLGVALAAQVYCQPFRDR